MSGFSSSKLWRIKNFFETYSNNSKLAPLVREIGWTHNLLILEKCKNDLGIKSRRIQTRICWKNAFKESNKPIGVSSYTVTPRLPKNLRKELPLPEQVAQLLEEV